jgi:hypothetical protein
MTIALAIGSLPGVILCADTQMTSDAGFKFEESKMLMAGEADKWCAHGVYAGNRNLARAVERKIEDVLQSKFSALEKIPTPEEFETCLERVLHKLVSKTHSGLSMFWAFSEPNYVHLYKVSGRLITYVFDWDCIGVGDTSLVRFIAETYHIVRTQDAARTANFIVQQAIKYVDGVGGSVEMWAVYRGGLYKRLRTSKLKGPLLRRPVLCPPSTSGT